MKSPQRKIYRSNILRHWPIEAQRKALAAIQGPFAEYEDVLPPRHRKGRSPDALAERGLMLRPTTRRNGAEVIYVASLGVLAWSGEDFMACLGAAQARNATVETLETGRSIPPTATASELADALREFLAARRKHQTADGQPRGHEASVIARRERDAARVALIAEDWRRYEIPTENLLVRAGRTPKNRKDVVPMAYRTAVKFLGPRPRAQAMRAGQLRRKEQVNAQA